MTDRAVSSILDVTVCLLLLSASALTLTHAPTTPGPEEANGADAALDVLTTSTAWVEYAPATESGSNRTAHGPLANLIAAGAVANATGHDESVAPPADSFRHAVARVVRRTAARIDVRMQILARWQPSPDSSVQGRFVVGSSPPPSTEVQAASTIVPWGPTEATHAHSVGEVRLLVRTWSP